MLCYIHIPFCASKCGYCGFNSLVNMMDFKEKYLDSLCVDLQNELGNLSLDKHSADSANFGRSQTPSLVSRPKFAENYESHTENPSVVLNGANNSSLRGGGEATTKQSTNKKFHSIYIGGGTPNMLNPSDYERIFKILSPRITPNTEITMELNPNASPFETIRAFKDLGVNRFSIGVQSFRADKLKLLERNHSPKIARKFIENTLKCGVKVSIDLIYDTILDSPKSLRFELENALNLGVGHISCYTLSIDSNSAFYAKNKRPVCDNSLCYDLKAILESRGFLQYEVSNFAFSHKSAHNLGYWAYRDYIGVGLGAVGKRSDKKQSDKSGIYRTYKNSDFGAYLANPRAFRRESLSDNDIRLEKIFLGLRSEVGVESALIADKNRLDLLVKSGKIRTQNGKIYATNYFLADEIALWVDSANPTKI